MSDHDYLWDPTAPPEPDVEQLERSLRRYRRESFSIPPSVVPAVTPLPSVQARGASYERGVARGQRRALVRWALAASAAFAVMLGARQVGVRQQRPWQVAVIAGSAPVRSSALRAPGARDGDRLAPGEWIETDSASSARLNVGYIGKAVIGPSSRLRLVRAAGTEHRLALARGVIHARIWAPPRFFLVETPGAMAVDLGCVYTLAVDSTGAGSLRVESGEVELTDGRRTILVPAGNQAILRPGGAVGLPVPVGADAGYLTLVAAIDAGVDDSATVAALIGRSGARRTITLWHLMERLPAARRGPVVGALLRLTPPPPHVDRSRIAERDPEAMRTWRASIEPTWSNEEVPSWMRLWRGLWRPLTRALT